MSKSSFHDRLCNVLRPRLIVYPPYSLDVKYVNMNPRLISNPLRLTEIISFISCMDRQDIKERKK